MNNSMIEAIIIASSLTQTRETHQEHKYIIDADITNVNCSDSTGERFFRSVHADASLLLHASKDKEIYHI